MPKARTRHAAKKHETCIYCGETSDQIEPDHMPPIGMFWERRRPDDLVFPSCPACNRGTKRSELVAQLLALSWPDADGPRLEQVVSKLTAVNFNVPGLLAEMQVGRGAEKIARRRTGIDDEGGFLRASGPILTEHMEVFGAKLGFALHFHATNRAIGPDGGVLSRWYSNLSEIHGELPNALIEALGPKQTLRQGRWEASDQFWFKTGATPNGSMSSCFAAFGGSFAVAAFASQDATRIEAGAQHTRIFRPGELKAPIRDRLQFRLFTDMKIRQR